MNRVSIVFVVLLLTLIGTAPVLVEGTAPQKRAAEKEDKLKSDEKFLEVIRQYQKMPRVTDEPYQMHADVALRCSFPPPGSRNPGAEFALSVHGNKYCDVFVSPQAEEPIRKGKQIYPVDSILIKAKYPDKQRSRIELFTVMRKRAKGYSPEHGDWEFSVVDADMKQVLSRGRTESCIECHDAFENSDFVS